MDEVHLRDELGQEQRLLDRRVAAADHADDLLLVQRSIARRAPRHAAPRELFLARDSELARHGPRRKDHDVGLELLALARQREMAVVERRDLLDRRERTDRRTVRLGLLRHQVAELGAVDAVGEARVVLDPVGRHDLTARDAALEHDGLGSATRGVERGRQSARSTADDGYLDVLSGHCAVTPAVVSMGRPAAAASLVSCVSAACARRNAPCCC